MPKQNIGKQKRATSGQAGEGMSCVICTKPIKEGIYIDISVMALYFDGMFTHTDEVYRSTLEQYACHLSCVEKKLNVHMKLPKLNAYYVGNVRNISQETLFKRSEKLSKKLKEKYPDKEVECAMCKFKDKDILLLDGNTVLCPNDYIIRHHLSVW